MGVVFLVGMMLNKPKEAWAQTEANQVLLEEYAQIKALASGRSVLAQKPGYRSPTLRMLWMARAITTAGSEAKELAKPLLTFKNTTNGFEFNWTPLRSGSTEEFEERTLLTPHFEIIQTMAPNPHLNFILSESERIVEEVYQKTIQQLGYLTPLKDGERYRLALVPLPGFYGATYPEGCEGSRCNSRIEVDDDFSFVMSGTETEEEVKQKLRLNLEITIAHEFFHSIQFGNYGLIKQMDGRRIRMDGWAVEGSAVWAEEQIYPTTNDYAFTYLPSFFNATDNAWTGLNFSNGTHVYGCAMYFKSLTEGLSHQSATEGLGYGPEVVREFFETWVNGPDDDPINALESLLAQKQEALPANLKKGTLQIAHQMWTGVVAESFVDSAFYPPVKVQETFAEIPFQRSIRTCEFCSYVYELDDFDQSPPIIVDWLVSGSTRGDFTASLVVKRSGVPTQVIPLSREVLPNGIVLRARQLPHPKKRGEDSTHLVVSTGADTDTTLHILLSKGLDSQTRTPFTMSLRKGWNLVSVPLNGDMTSPAEVFKSGETILAQDTSAGTLKIVSPEESNFPEMDRPGRPYLIFANRDRDYNITGVHQKGASHSFRTGVGYNLIGNPYFSPVNLKDNLLVISPEGKKMSLDQARQANLIGHALYVLDESGSYNISKNDQLKTGEAGWVLIKGGNVGLEWITP